MSRAIAGCERLAGIPRVSAGSSRVLRVVPTMAVLANPLDTKWKWEFRILELW
jgi:hypothetical protein